MKQTKKLGRRQREFLEKLGVEGLENYRVCYENTRELVCYDMVKGTEVKFVK